MRLMFSRSIGLLVSSGCVSAGAIAQTAEVSHRIAARSGAGALPGEPEFVFDTEGAFVAPVLNNRGHLAFVAAEEDEDVAPVPAFGVWRGEPGRWTLVAGHGDAAPGAPGAVFDQDFLGPTTNGAGRVAFLARLSGAGVTPDNDEGVWSDGAGPLRLLAREGDIAPSVWPESVFASLLSEPVLSETGRVAFLAGLRYVDGESRTVQSVWSDRFGVVAPVAREGEIAPGPGPTVRFARFSTPLVDAAGGAAFLARVAGSGVSDASDGGLWREGSGGVELVAREGGVAPGTGLVFVELPVTELSMNSRGELTFRARLGDGSDIYAGEDSLWLRDELGLALLARAGDPAPGAGLGVTHESFGHPVIDESGRVAFLGRVRGPGIDETNNACIWIADGAQLTLVARTGGPAPGAGAGDTFTEFVDPVLNDAGQVAFIAWFEGLTAYPSTDEGVWATDPSGKLAMLVREGRWIDLSRDPHVETMRKIEHIWSVGNRRATSFNQRGEFVFGASFYDGEVGLVIATLHEDGLPCAADTTTHGTANGVPDGQVSLDDLGVYLNFWSESHPRADITVADRCDISTGGDGVSLSDFSCYLTNWARGCVPE